MRTLFLALALIGAVESLDVRARDAVQAAREPWLEPVMEGASDIGRPAVVYGMMLAIAILDPLGPSTARLAICALVPTNLAVELTKRSTLRARPDGERKTSNSAFPSSHAANAFAVAWVLARRWRRLGPAFWLIAALVAVSRIYLNRHWTSDVVVGAVYGVVFAAAAARWLYPPIERWYRRRAGAGDTGGGLLD
jgi:membrane-associated phospholipid phosphatase